MGNRDQVSARQTAKHGSDDRDIEGHVWAEGFQLLAVTVRRAQRAGGLPGPRKDPFDRMLIAQALEEGCTMISNEAVFDRYGVPRSW
jgi:PIN domain nuclease of toxin-antitoxin system